VAVSGGTDSFFKELNKCLSSFSTRDSCLFREYYNFFCRNMAFLTVVFFFDFVLKHEYQILSR
jgi:hypothetical protein